MLATRYKVCGNIIEFSLFQDKCSNNIFAETSIILKLGFSAYWLDFTIKK